MASISASSNYNKQNRGFHNNNNNRNTTFSNRGIATSSTTHINELFCNNCGKNGHQFHQCKMPITSIGVVAFRFHPEKRCIQYLMIRRKDTLGYMDFMRGKFPIYQKNYILNMMKQMTVDEKRRLRNKALLLKNVADTGCNGGYPGSSANSINGPAGPPPPPAPSCGVTIKDKIHALIVGIDNNGDKYDMFSLLTESELHGTWLEPEWGFPKGRRNQQENDYDCALREFSEETGYESKCLKNIRNIIPFEEIFTGSNYKSYRHKYYLMYIDFADSLSVSKPYQKSEVSAMEWKTIDECILSIRPYNLEKIRMLINLNECLMMTTMCGVGMEDV
jgi:8-oxo-dGTP pyrophosphatase MutT (NUDIX family)